MSDLPGVPLPSGFTPLPEDEADDLYHRWKRQVDYLVAILARWDEQETALCVAYCGQEPAVEPGSLIADTREAIAMARGHLTPEQSRAALSGQQDTEGDTDE